MTDPAPIRSDRPPSPGELLPEKSWGPWHWLAAVVIVAVLVSLLLPPVTQSGRSGRRSVSQNNLKQIGLAGHNYHAVFGAFPPHAVDGSGNLSISGAENPVPSWQTASLPFLDQPKLWRAYDAAKRFDDPANAAVVATEVAAFIDPHPSYEGRHAEGGFALSHYAGNVRVLGEGGAPRLSQIVDGTTQTIYAGQIGGFPKPWADPANLRDTALGFGRSPRQFGGPYYEGTGGHVVMCDGSVRFISESIDPAVFAALGTPDGGEAIEGSGF